MGDRNKGGDNCSSRVTVTGFSLFTMWVSGISNAHPPSTSNFRLSCPICAEQPGYPSLDGHFFRSVHIVFSHSFLLFVWLSHDLVTSLKLSEGALRPSSHWPPFPAIRSVLSATGWTALCPLERVSSSCSSPVFIWVRPFEEFQGGSPEVPASFSYLTGNTQEKTDLDTCRRFVYSLVNPSPPADHGFSWHV